MMRSLPTPPRAMSTPPRAMMASSPSNPRIRSRSWLPTRMSRPGVPSIGRAAAGCGVMHTTVSRTNAPATFNVERVADMVLLPSRRRICTEHWILELRRIAPAAPCDAPTTDAESRTPSPGTSQADLGPCVLVPRAHRRLAVPGTRTCRVEGGYARRPCRTSRGTRERWRVTASYAVPDVVVRLAPFRLT